MEINYERKIASYIRFWILNLTLTLFGLTSCIGYATHPLIQPITPKSHRFWNLGEPKVETIQPTFRWKPRSRHLAPDVAYDLIVYKADFHFYETQSWSPGQVVFFREGLRETSFRLDKPLNSNGVYIWSVRVHEGGKTSEWASYNYGTITPVPGAVFGFKESLPFVFRTPAK